MDPILVLTHDDICPIGWLGAVIDEAGIPTETVALHHDQPLPSRRWTAIVSLGGEMGAYEEEQYPFLSREKLLITSATNTGTPVLGICLGAQIVADALGGRAYRATSLELGYPHVLLTAAGRIDRVVGKLAGPVLVWHRDTFDLPPRAKLLAYTDRYPQAFRVGRSPALQFHAEAPPEVLDSWFEEADEARLAAHGVDRDHVTAEAYNVVDRAQAVAQALFGSWIEEVIEYR